MTTQNDLRSLLGDSSLKLISSSRTNGTSYTEDERQLAGNIARVVLVAANVIDDKTIDLDTISEDIKAAVQLAVESMDSNELSAVALMRAVYRTVEANKLADPTTVEAFPKVDGKERVPRDFSSINLIFRGGLKGVVSDEIRDKLFKNYYKTSSKSV